MSFTPRGIDTATGGWFPFPPACCVRGDRRCGSLPIRYPMHLPPWYTCPPKCPPIKRPLIPLAQNSYGNQRDYLPHTVERLLTPYATFWHYCDVVADLEPGDRYSTNVVKRRPTGGFEDWPPLEAGVCVDTDSQPCPQGPFTNPDLRRFIYVDCV